LGLLSNSYLNKSEKIILSTVLTWIIFGLFNLFGQPQYFLPPLPYNGIIIAVVAFILYLQHKDHNYQNYGYYLFTAFVLLCICAIFYEAYEVNTLFYTMILLIVFIAILFPIVLIKQIKYPAYFWTYLLLYTTAITAFILMLIPFNESDAGIYIYFFTGLLGLAGNIIFRNTGDKYIENTIWLYILTVFFDAGQYFVINYLI
jgi:hypothetical protein